MCADWSEEDCSMSHDSIQKGEATGSVEVSKASVVTWVPREAEAVGLATKEEESQG